MNLVEIEWLDSIGGRNWESIEQARSDATPEAMRFRTVGYVLADEPDFLLVAGSRSESGANVDGTVQIPRGAIRSVRQLRRK